MYMLWQTAGAVVVQLPADLTNPVAKGNCVEGGVLHVQGVAHFVQGDHGIHQQLALLAHRPLLEEVAHLVAGLHEVQLLALGILLLDGAEDLAVRLWSLHAEGPAGLEEGVHLLGREEVLDDDVAILVQLQAKGGEGSAVNIVTNLASTRLASAVIWRLLPPQSTKCSLIYWGYKFVALYSRSGFTFRATC